MMDNQIYPGTATPVFELVGHNPGCTAGGKLYVNGLDQKKLKELRDWCKMFLADKSIK